MTNLFPKLEEGLFAEPEAFFREESATFRETQAIA
jgi:hypothetical protein